MSSWDPIRLAESFDVLAESADRRTRECKSKIVRSSAYRAMHDEALADYMFSYRFADAGRTASPEVMIHWLTNFNPADMSNEAFDERVFVAAMDRQIAEWKARAEAEISSRKAESTDGQAAEE